MFFLVVVGAWRDRHQSDIQVVILQGDLPWKISYRVILLKHHKVLSAASLFVFVFDHHLICKSTSHIDNIYLAM